MALPFTLRQLEIFDAVVRAGSLSAAAGELTTAQSSVSSAIDELERQVGQRLLVRRKAQGAWPTAAGRQLHREAVSILRSAQEAGRMLQERDGRLRGPLAVGVYHVLAPYILPMILADFGRAHPQVELSSAEVRHTELMAGIASGAVDVGFTYPHEIPDGVDREEVLRGRPRVLFPAGHPLARCSSVTVRDISQEPVILLGGIPSKTNTLDLLGITEQDPRIRAVASTVVLMRALVGRGLGVAVMFHPDASPCTVDGHAVVEVPLDVEFDRAHVHAVWVRAAERRRPPRRITELVSFMRQGMSGHVGRPLAGGAGDQ